MTSINDPITLSQQQIKGCREGFHDLNTETAEFKLEGNKMIVSMRCNNCGQQVHREEAASALIPADQIQSQPQPEQIVAPQQPQEQIQQPRVVERVIVVHEPPLYEGARQSDDFWDQFKK
jgi:hypothetical protein